MGQVGDQDIKKNQNNTLSESNINGIEVYLFEVFEPKIYTFIGRVRLIGDPFTENQLDKEKQERDVWIFPLQLIDGNKNFEIDMKKTILETKSKKGSKKLAYR